MIAASSGVGSAATAASTLNATVLSATTFLPSCTPGSGATDIGSLAAGSTGTTSADCSFTFGSSNDTARLRMYQADGGGDAMWHPPDGPVDATVGAGTGAAMAVVSNDTSYYDVAYDPAIDRYYATGHGDDGDFLVRFKPDGTLDTTWASGTGWIHPAMGDGTSDSGYDIAIQPDGKVVVAGRSFDASNGGDYVGAYRVTAAGILDPSFGGGDGWVQYFPGSGAIVSGVTLQEDGRIVLCGTSLAIGGDSNAFVARLLADGTLDTSFGDGDLTPGDGVSFLVDSSVADCESVTTDPVSGHIVASGRNFSGTWQTAVWRLLADGSPDPSWNGTGHALIGAGSYDHSYDVHVLPDSRVMAGGTTSTAQDEGYLVRFTSTGGVDGSFGGGDGHVEFTTAGSTADAINSFVAYEDGSSMVVGSRTAGDDDSLVARYTAGGVLDPQFGTGGVAIQSWDATNDDVLAGITIGRDGRSVVVGSRTPAAGAVNGLFGAFTATPVADYDGVAASWTGASASVFGACVHASASAALTGWTQDAACSTATDGAMWKAVPDTQALGSVATTATNVTTGSVGLRFAFRTTASQRAGLYVAPMAFEVVAPQ
jgi:uncharacterized delta-60 repeat protein